MIISIPDLIAKHGNIADTCRATGLSELTIGKYRFDYNCEEHVIYNGKLMTHKCHSPVLYSRPGVTNWDREKTR